MSEEAPKPELSPPSGPAYELPPPPVSEIDEWQRLTPRNLLLYPVRTVGQLLVPLVIAFLGFGRSDGGGFSLGPGAFVAVAGITGLLGVIPWLTTRYRLTETQIQVRRGLLNRKLLTAPLDRVRSVDLESNIMHRALRMSKVSIGTGVDSTKIDLDALSVDQAHKLQEYLLARKRLLAAGRVPAATDTPNGAGIAPGRQARADRADAEAPDVELTRIDWSWLRYAPFSLSSLVVVAGVGALLGQFASEVDFSVQESSAQELYDWFTGRALVVLALVGATAVLVGWLALSTLTYVISWWNLRVTRTGEGTLRLVRGLLTTNSTTIEEAKIRGVAMTEPALLRLVKGAELVTLSTGVGDGGQTKVLPPCPRAVAVRVGHEVLEEQGALTLPLRRHGPAARRRCYIRGFYGALFPTIGVLFPTWWFDWPWWVLLLVFVVWMAGSLPLAELEYRNLGHGVTDAYVMSSHGALSLTREVLEQAGVIGWVIRQTVFQRRVGLATLVATTAAGSESVRFYDIPLDAAVALAAATSPEALGEFLEPTH
ncbi:MAG: PH domain-containing protein [Ornithinimicrobium sp.]